MQAVSAVVRRIVYGILLLLAVIVFNFTLIHLAPGDPAETIAGEMGGATEEIIQQIRVAYGLDKSLPEQLLTYLGRIVQGDLGNSFYFNSPVADLILERLPATLLLVFAAMFLAVLTGTVLGVIASRNPHGLFSNFVTLVALVGYAAPAFWLGLMALILFASTMPIFPISGMQSIGRDYGAFGHMFDVLHHLVLPAITLAIIFVAIYSRLARASMLEVLGSDYIRTARAKGLNERVVVYKHALRNALLPVVTIAGIQFGQAFAGAVLVETVFNWPGMGQLAFESILRRDHPTMLGILFFSALVVIIANILTDILYRIIDPRIRTSSD